MRTVVHGKFMSLSGEICSTWRCGVVSPEYQLGHWFTKPWRTEGLSPGASERDSKASGPQSAPGSNPRRDRTEVSRGHTSRFSLEGWAVKGQT